MKNSSSLRSKFTWAIATGTVMATILSAMGFSWIDWNRFSARTSAEVSALTNIVASQLGAAVMLHDQQAAAEVLGSLHTDLRIKRAEVYGASGECFALFNPHSKGNCLPRLPDGIVTQSSFLVITRPVTAGDERIGTVSLTADLPTISEVVSRYIAGATLVIVFSLVVSVGLAFFLQTRVTAPILVIASAAREMARTHQLGMRVPVSSTDEVGTLAASFNLMLQQLEEREKELALHREQLERDVAERGRINAELHQAKEKAESAVRIKAEFLANMSHEIRTPLNGVSGMINLAHSACSDSGVREQLSFAQTAAQSLITIVNDILDFSKAEAGKMTLECVNFNLRKILEECFQLFTLTAREKNLALGYTIDASCPGWLQGDPIRLRQVLVNLVGNAVKFTTEGSVRLSVRTTESGSIRFEVTDTGIGIPAHKLRTIFEPFTQADGSHTRRFGGSGLGLAITQRLVQLMGGRLWAETEPDHGSSFFVEAPLPAGSEESMVEVKPIEAELRPLHVLVAEDNLVNQKVICGLLRRRSWSMKVVNDGGKAFKEFQDHDFDLILMDVQMPNIDGLEATRMIRKEESRRALKRIPILALTAHASPSDHVMCFEAGMDGVIVKPINTADLFDRISGAMEAQTTAVAS